MGIAQERAESFRKNRKRIDIMSGYSNTWEISNANHLIGIIKVMTKYDFVNEMGSDAGFSRQGLFALFEYLDNLAEDTGQSIQFDYVAIKLDYSEYSSLQEACLDYTTDIADDLDTDASEEEIDQACREYLEENTILIEFDGGVIIQNF